MRFGVGQVDGFPVVGKVRYRSLILTDVDPHHLHLMPRFLIENRLAFRGSCRSSFLKRCPSTVPVVMLSCHADYSSSGRRVMRAVRSPEPLVSPAARDSAPASTLMTELTAVRASTSKRLATSGQVRPGRPPGYDQPHARDGDGRVRLHRYRRGPPSDPGRTRGGGADAPAAGCAAANVVRWRGHSCRCPGFASHPGCCVRR